MIDDASLVDGLDLSPRAHQFLFDRVVLDAALTLGDVLGLLVRCPALVDVFARFGARELVDEIRLGPDPEAAPEAVVALLRRSWLFDRRSRTCAQTGTLVLTGLGPVQDQDQPERGLQAGQREAHALLAAQVRQSLSLPLVLDPETPVFDLHARGPGASAPLVVLRVPEVSLGQLLHAVIGDLCFHGGPAACRAFLASLQPGAAAP